MPPLRMWNLNGQAQLDRNWPVLLADATAKGWTWTPAPYAPPTTRPDTAPKMR